MASSSYSFLDVAVLDEVRARFAAGDALVILSNDLDEVIWANGPGAALFGHSDIDAIIGGPSQLAQSTKRQIASTSDFPHIGTGRTIAARMAGGLTSRTMAFQASAVTLPDGEAAIMLAVPAAAGGGRSPEVIAVRAIAGFEQPGHFVAFIDAAGNVEAASPGFLRLGISRDSVAGLVTRLQSTAGRIVKRMLPSASGQLPAGIARLTDDPARHFLVVIDESRIDRADGEDDGEATAADETALPRRLDPPRPDNDAGQAARPLAPARHGEIVAEGIAEPIASARPATPSGGDHDHWYFEPVGRMEPPVPDTIGSGAAEVGPAEPAAEIEIEGGGSENERVGDAVQTDVDAEAQAIEAAAETAETAQAGLDSDGASNVTVVEPEMETEVEAVAEDHDAPAEPEPEPVVADFAAAEPVIAPQPVETSQPAMPTAPLRFVWRTDAGGRFSQVSPEFAAAVGLNETQLLGRAFSDVAQRLSLDPDGEIAGLLARRDTWSGRSVMWPVAGADTRIPVDLAALPVYSRLRAFEGFRGFGVARFVDAVSDPGASLLRLADPAEATAEVPAAEPALPPATEAADPFRGEVPAISVAPAQERRYTDKVIRLAEHRPPSTERTLSTGERIAFQQIAERLRRDSKTDETKPAVVEVPPVDEAAPASDVGDGVVVSQVDPEPDTEATTAEPISIIATTDTDDAVDSGIEAEALTENEAIGDLLAFDGAAEVPSSEAIGDAAVMPSDDAPTGEAPVQDALRLQDPVPSDDGSAFEPQPRGPRGGLSMLGGWDDEPEHEPADDLPEDGPASDAVAAQPADEPAEYIVGDSESVTGTDAIVENKPDAATADAAVADMPLEAVEPELPAAGEAPAAETAPDVEAEETPPPLQADGFTPSAFSTGSEEDRRKPDTSILEKLPVPVLVHSGDVLHYANADFFALTGYRSIADLAAAGGIGALFAEPYEDEDSPERRDTQLRLRRSDGEEFPVEAFLQSVRWGQGKALLLVLSRLRQNQSAQQGQSPLIAELETRVAEMRTILDTATDGVVLIARDGSIRSISRPAEALFGFDSDEVAGRPFVSLFAIESQRAARDYLNGLLDNGVASVLNDGREVIGREAEGRFIPLFMTIGRLPNESGFCAVMRDITPWKRAEEEMTQARAVAERASSQKTEFLARVSHEIRTPLNAIIGFSELMVDEKFGPIANDRYRDYLRDINRSGNHVLDLVNDLLDISKIEAGQQDMAYEAVSLNDTLAETVALMQPQANRERVIIRSSFASRLPDVVADLRSIRQIALNILSNAVRYTQAGGQVIVSTSYEPTGDVLMRVRDTGIGMTPAEIEQALKPFRQINALKRARGDGTGLGLPLTKAMVEANRARFTINSEPGEGTLVEITFPSTRVLAD